MKSSDNKEDHAKSNKTFGQEKTCPVCHGRGTIVDRGIRPCPYCSSSEEESD